MKRIGIITGAAVTFAIAAPAFAQDAPVDLTDPVKVAAALKAMGHEVELKTDSSGDPMIAASVDDTSFTISFYTCQAKLKCESMQFSSWWQKEPWFTTDLVNEWNRSKRFLRVVVDKDGNIIEYLDLPGIDTVSFKYFKDAVEWYRTMDADFSNWLGEHKPEGEPKQ